MRNIKLVLEYDGTNYCGWQTQPNGISIQEVLENKIAVLTRTRVRVIGSGRTDAGVHALNQVANFITGSLLPCENIVRGLNSLLPTDIAIRTAEDQDERFHARYSAKSKIYLYRIYNAPTRSSLLYRYSGHIYDKLDCKAMDEASYLLEGSHDFSSFCASNDGSKSHVRTIIGHTLKCRHGGIIDFEIEANGFLRHMVRNIVGTLIDVGRGRLSKEQFRDIFESRDRTQAGVTAPPQGLYLKYVKY